MTGLRQISTNPRAATKSSIAEATDLLQPEIPPLAMTPRDAALGRKQVVPLGEAVGRTCAESIMFYPPGIPLLMPGEEVTADILSVCRALLSGGAHCYASDPTLGTMRVVA
jgi:lysine decarboxylase